MAMIRHREREPSRRRPMRLLYSSRTLEDVIYREELDELAAARTGVEVIHTLTRAQPDGLDGIRAPHRPEMLREVAWPAADEPAVFVCGATRFVEAVADGLVGLGYDPADDQDRALRRDGRLR